MPQLRINMKITGVVITRNEEKMLAEALESLTWVDDLLVVDSGSTDKTIQIAQKNGARVEKSNGTNFSEWRNKALKESKGDWILYLDADERITPELKTEILESVVGSKFAAYAIPRRNVILGQEFRFGGQRPDYVKRLYKKSSLKSWRGHLHEEPDFEGEMGHLRNSILHLKHEDISEMIEKTNQWSEVEAKLMFEANHPPMTIPRFVSAAFREFWKRMVLQVAFLDGPKGFIYAMYQVFSRLVSYTKLWELQLRKGIIK